jgi:hypothetical protein
MSGADLSLLSRQRDEAVNGLVLFAEDHAGPDFRQLLDSGCFVCDHPRTPRN